jgi:hypothetical protein
MVVELQVVARIIGTGAPKCMVEEERYTKKERKINNNILLKHIVEYSTEE